MEASSTRAERLRARISEPTHEFVRLFLPVTLIGVGAGLGAVVFRKLISFFTTVFFTDYASWTHAIYPFNIISIPVIGALLFGPMIWRWAREARGHGVPEVMEAVALRGGKIRPVVAVVKSLASSINIGSGGSIGREGPIAQIGSALGSSVGQVLKLPPRLLRLLVTAGAAAGIAATFNAPIAGALFGLEVILRDFTPLSFAVVGLASVLADLVAIPFLGSKAFFVLPAGVGLRSPYELIIFVVLGLLAAIVGTYFTQALYWLEDVFNGWKLHEALRPAAGAILLGILIVLLPPVRGLGYNIMALVFDGRLGLGILLLFFVGKFLATTLTLGSGGSGGIFTPTLYMGTMLGGLVGLVSAHLFPGVVGNSAGYALIGAAAVFAAAARAPITAVLIVMEMSQNYVLAIPLILTTLVATRTSEFMMQDSIYTMKLTRRGVRILQQTAVDVLSQVKVSEAMLTDVAKISPDATLVEATHLMSRERRQSLLVVQDGELQGIITIADLEHSQEGTDQAQTVKEITVRDLLVAYPEEELREAVRRMNRAGVGQLPVVPPDAPHHVLGLLRRVDVISALESKLGTMPPPDQAEAPRRVRAGAFIQVTLPATSPHAYHQLRDLKFPPGLLVVVVNRGRHTIVPKGDTELLPDDEVMVYVMPKEGADEAREFILSGKPYRKGPQEELAHPVA